MTAKQLTDSILQLAIQGKLVPQDSNDEPASVLLDKIREEKRRLVKEGVLKKKDIEEIPIDEEPFPIPDNWAWVRLSTLSRAIHYGYTASASPSGNAKLLRITDIQNDKVNWASVPFCTIKEKDLKTYQLHNRDILIARTGGTIGKTYIVRELKEISVFASYLIRAIPLDNANEEYIKLFMGSPFYWSQLIDATSGTGQPNVNGQSLSKLIVPLPPLAEQHRIVERIEEILPIVKEYGEAYEEASKMDASLPEMLKKSILQEAIMGNLGTQDDSDEPASKLLEHIREEKKRLVMEGVLKKKDLEETPVDEDEEPFKVPESWMWVRLNNFFTITSGLSYKKDDLAIQSDEMVRVLRGGNISFGDWQTKPDDVLISSQFVDNSLLLKENTFITPAVSSLEHMGKTALIRTNQDNVVVGGFILMLSPIYPQPVLQEYFNILFQSYFYRKLCQSLTNKSGQAFYNLSRTKLLNAIIPLPPLEEQQRIVKRVKEFFAEIDNMTINKDINETDIEETEE